MNFKERYSEQKQFELYVDEVIWQAMNHWKLLRSQVKEIDMEKAQECFGISLDPKVALEIVYNPMK